MNPRVSYRFTAEEFSHPMNLHTWKAKKRSAFTRIILGTFVLGCGLATLGKSPLAPYFLVFSIVYITTILLSTRIALFKMRKMPMMGVTVTLEATEAELKISGEGLNSSINWGLVHSAYIGKRGALIYQSKRLFNWFPFEKAEPATAPEDLKTLLTRAGVKVESET